MNLNEDATLSECLLYYIKEGVTRVGSPEANAPQDIQLVGTHILKEHCVFENKDSVVKFIPMVNARLQRGAEVVICPIPALIVSERRDLLCERPQSGISDRSANRLQSHSRQESRLQVQPSRTRFEIARHIDLPLAKCHTVTVPLF